MLQTLLVLMSDLGVAVSAAGSYHTSHGGSGAGFTGA